VQRNVRLFHPHYFRHSFHYFNQVGRLNRLLTLLLSAAVITLIAIFFRGYFGFIFPSSTNLGSISIPDLLLAALFSFSRLLVSYFISLILALAIAIIVTSHHRIENFLLPILDVLQSVPVLAFFPIAVVAFAKTGFLEGAAVFILLTAMLWSILFSVLGAIHSIPRDIELAAEVFGARRFKYLRHILLPATFPSIITGSILAWGAGWNIVIVAEFINFGGIHEILPGLGSTLDQAASGAGPASTVLFIAALLTLVALVVVLNRLIWQPLLNYSERFKFD
jgi:NitT/TauT family transport system permease protein